MKKIILISLLTLTSALSINAQVYVTEITKSIHKNQISVKDTLNSENNNNSGESQEPAVSTVIDSDFSIQSCSNWHCYGFIEFNSTRVDFGGTGWHLVVVDPADDSIVLSKSYNTFYFPYKADEFTTDVQSIPNGHFVIIGTQDEPTNNQGSIPATISTELNGDANGLSYRGTFLYAGYKGGEVITNQKAAAPEYGGVTQISYNYSAAIGGEFQYSASCKEILEAGLSTGNGVYTIDNGFKEYEVYCDMTTDGGGWTLVVAQFEQDPVTNWNEGIQADYDPTLSTNRGFVLNSAELPSHTQFAMAQSTTILNPSSDIINGVYSTSNIAKTVVQSIGGVSYHIHRNASLHYGSHDPESSSTATNHPDWRNTLTIDRVGQSGFDFAFSPNHNNYISRGYSFKGSRWNSSESYSWSIFVR